MNIRYRSATHILKSLGARLRRMANRRPPELEGRSLRQLLGKSDPTILEIGCNDGEHTLWFLREFKNARVYAFEPDKRAQAAFRSKVQDPRATLFEFAIASEDGELDFHASTGTPPPGVTYDRETWDLSGSIRKPKNHLTEFPWVTFGEVSKVPAQRLDSWADEHGITAIDFIWADVQGAELDLIQGARETLKKTRFLYTEYSNAELYEGQLPLTELLKALPAFEVVERYSTDVLLRNALLR